MKYTIRYGFGTAVLYTPYPPKDRFFYSRKYLLWYQKVHYVL